MTQSSIVVTGCAGFIGMHVTQTLLKRGENVIGIDNLDPYYSVQLKRDRLSQLLPYKTFNFHEVNIVDKDKLNQIWKEAETSDAPILSVINLAAQAGVRYSLTHPEPYIQTNLVGFSNLLELCAHQKGFKHLVYASSSSVYGGNKTFPFSEDQKVSSPLSLYAATKGANELMAHAYHNVYGIAATGLRFFTVYGPWGRPDMAAFKFAQLIQENKPIEVYNHGKMKRDFTYVDDIVQGVIASLDMTNNPNFKSRHEVYNLGNNRSEVLDDYIGLIEQHLGKRAQRDLLPLQVGDVPETYADISKAQRDFNFNPQTTIQEGIPNFINWFKSYYKLGEAA